LGVGTIFGRVSYLLSAIAVVTTCLTGLAQAEGVTLTDENREVFAQVYKAVRSIDRVVGICANEDVDTPVDNQAIADAFMARTALDQTRPILNEVIEVQPDLGQRLNGDVENELAPLKEQLGSWDICGAQFEELLNLAELPDVASFMQVFGDDIDLDQVIKQPDGLVAEGQKEPLDVQAQPKAAAEASPLDIELVTITSGNYPHFSEVYNAVGSIDWLSDVCSEEAPESVSQNQDIIASLIPDQRLGQIRTFLEATIQAQPEIQTDLNAAFEQQEAMLQRAFGHSMPLLCRQRFKPMVIPHVEALPDASTFGQTLASMAASAPDVQAGEVPASPVESSTDVAATDALPMPPVSGESMEALPGLGWQMPDGVRANNQFRAHCVWRCAVFKHKGEAFPFLTVHEAVPLSAEEALNNVLAASKRPIAEQQNLDMSGFQRRMAMQPDRMIGRDVHVQDTAKQNLRWMLAFEKNGLTVIAELFYPGGLGLSKTSVDSNALVQLVASLDMNVDAVHASLMTPVVQIERPSNDTPPGPDQVIYAEDPTIVYNTRLVGSYDGPVTSFQFDADTRMMDRSVLDSEGPALEIDGDIYRYRPRQKDGTTIEGVFESPYRYQAFDTVFDLLNGRRLAFNRDGRFGLVLERDYQAGLVSTGSFSQDIGTYRINGYMIELRSHNGAVQQELFFPYDKKISLGGKVMYPISVIK
jgi:hypothetical protein